MDNKEDSLLLPLPSWTVTVTLLTDEHRTHLIPQQSSDRKYWCPYSLSEQMGRHLISGMVPGLCVLDEQRQLPMAKVKFFMACPFVKPRLIYVVALSAHQAFLMPF